MWDPIPFHSTFQTVWPKWNVEFAIQMGKNNINYYGKIANLDEIYEKV